MKEDVLTIPVQINGKMRGMVEVSAGAGKEEVLEQAKQAVAGRLAGATLVKEIYVPGKIVNLVVKE